MTDKEAKAHEAARENLKEAWAALAMLRETVETLAPSGSVKAAEHLEGPTFMHEAEALVAGVVAIAGEPGAMREALERIVKAYGSMPDGHSFKMHDAIVKARAALAHPQPSRANSTLPEAAPPAYSDGIGVPYLRADGTIGYTPR